MIPPDWMIWPSAVTIVPGWSVPEAGITVPGVVSTPVVPGVSIVAPGLVTGRELGIGIGAGTVVPGVMTVPGVEMTPPVVGYDVYGWVAITGLEEYVVRPRSRPNSPRRGGVLTASPVTMTGPAPTAGVPTTTGGPVIVVVCA